MLCSAPLMNYSVETPSTHLFVVFLLKIYIYIHSSLQSR